MREKRARDSLGERNCVFERDRWRKRAREREIGRGERETDICL